MVTEAGQLFAARQSLAQAVGGIVLFIQRLEQGLDARRGAAMQRPG
jgi:hypothetical protein